MSVESRLRELEGEVEELRRKLKTARQEMDVWRASGLDDLATGHGYQRYGVGNMRTHRTGQQILVPNTNTNTYNIYWTPSFFSDTPPADRGTNMNGRRSDNDAWWQVTTSSDLSDTTPNTYAVLELDAYDDAGGAYVISQVQFNALIAKIEVTSDGAGVYAYISPALRLASQTSDPATLTDGMVWYRSDTDKFKGRQNGVTENFAMESWALAATRGNWKVFYSDGSGVFTELTLGASGTVLTSNGASSAPSFATAAAGGWLALPT